MRMSLMPMCSSGSVMSPAPTVNVSGVCGRSTSSSGALRSSMMLPSEPTMTESVPALSCGTAPPPMARHSVPEL